MMFKSKLTCFIGSLAIAGTALAFPLQTTTGCPSAKAIKSVKIAEAEELMSNHFYTFVYNKYGTKIDWIFVLGPIEAPSKPDAIKAANQLLPQVSGNPSPDSGTDGILCNYDIGGGYLALAMPAAVGSYKLKQMMLQKK